MGVVVSGFVSRVESLRFRASGFMFRVPGVGLHSSGFGLRDSFFFLRVSTSISSRFNFRAGCFGCRALSHKTLTRKVGIRLPGKESSKYHGARPVH